MKKTIKWAIPFVFILGLVAFQHPASDRAFDIVKNLDIFITAFKEVNSYYVDEVNPNQLMKTGLDAMLASLDPYTNYIPEDAIEDYRTMTTGEYGGIGALVDKKKGISTIVLPYEGFPAQKAGLLAGDQIISINGIGINDKSSDEISKLLKGASDSEIQLEIQRFGKNETFMVDVVREKITIDNVPYYGMITQDVGFVKLTDFTTNAGGEVKKAVVELKGKGAKKIILDLRGNPGGLLEEAVNVSNVFVDKGKEVVTTRGRLEADVHMFKTKYNATDIDIPLAVLTSSGSASAAEIVSGVMQDYDRGVLVGQRTYGKGLVQQTRPLAYNSQIKVTTSKYYIPSGRCIQAIDYSHRNPDGSVGKIPDSLKAEFHTVKGRLVYDGGGVNPDVTTEEKKYSQLAKVLMTQDLVFDYATEYYFSHESIGSALDFHLSDAEYDAFVNWLDDKEYQYETRIEKSITNLIAAAKEDKYYDGLKDQIDALQTATLHNKRKDLYTFKEEIRGFLEREICSRYYFEDGAIEATLLKDEDVKEAIKVLNDQDLYNQILQKSN